MTGDGKTDLGDLAAIERDLLHLQSRDQHTTIKQWGNVGDIPDPRRL